MIGLPKKRPTWSQETIVAAIQKWAEENGRPPRTRDWDVACGNGSRPGVRCVKNRWGSWNAAIEAAGLTPAVAQGGTVPRVVRGVIALTPGRAERLEQVVPLFEAGKSTTEISEALDLSRSYVRDLLNDPSGAKVAERKKRYKRTCDMCGGPTSPRHRVVDGHPKTCAWCQRGRVNPNLEVRRGTPKTLQDATKEQLLDAAYELCCEVDTVGERGKILIATALAYKEAA